MEDNSLIKSVKKRETGAFKKMYEAYIRYVYAIVVRYVANSSDHQDVIQEIFAHVFLKIDTYNEKKGEFKFWLRRLTINQCIDHFHKTKKNIDMVPLDSKAFLQVDTSRNTAGMSKDELLEFLAVMPSGYKEIFMLVVIDEYSHKEVAKMLNISAETSRSQLHRAKNWLKENLPKDTQNLMASGIKY